MLEIMGIIIKFIWDILSIEIPVDQFRFKIWQYMAFIIVIAIIVKAIKTNVESGGDK
jgi:hypothetical protein